MAPRVLKIRFRFHVNPTQSPQITGRGLYRRMQTFFPYLPTDDIYKAAERDLSVDFGILTSKSSFRVYDMFFPDSFKSLTVTGKLL